MPLAARAIVLTLPLLAASQAAAQVERCVRNEPEFTLAWAVAQASSSEPLVIRLAQGAYDLALTPLGNDAAGTPAGRPVSLLGGYNASCTSRSQDPSATTLTSSRELTTRFVNIKTTGGATGDLELERLRFFNLNSLDLRTETSSSPERSLRISRVVFDRVRSTFVGFTTDVVIDNSVFWRGGNASSPALPFTSCALEVDGVFDYLERLVIRHSTFVASEGAGALCVGTDLAADANDWSINLHSTIFRNNGPVDIRLRKHPSRPNIPATLRNNIYATLDANRPLTSAPVATLNVDPLFVDAAGGNFRLQGASPAINSGRTDVNLVGQLDFEGNPRWFGQAPDRGAFESNIGSTSPVLTVTNANDSGPGSLRQALIDANAAPDLNTIRFNIAGACPRTITLASLLPDIIHPVAIEGYSQPGSARNTAVLGWNATLCVVLSGANQITGAYGFNVNTGASANATVSIEGIAFSGHSIAAAQFIGGRDHRFTGNQVGGTVGTALLPSATGVRVGAAVEGVRIGGPEPADRNVIANATGIGINVSGSGSTQPSRTAIENNYIGTQSGGDVRGNNRGILIRGFDGIVRGNVVSNSTSHGIELDGALAMANRIEGNRIGIPAVCATCANRGNGGHGVLVRNGADGNRVNDNRIAFSGLDGITVAAARQNTLRRNEFHDNAGIGIDLGDDGINFADVNNAQPPPIGAGNDAQNKPRLSSVLGDAGTAWAAGTLNTANGWYRIDFYGAPGCTNLNLGPVPVGAWGQARDWLGSTVIQVSGGSFSTNGSGSFQGVGLQRAGNPAYFDEQRRVMATATRLQTSGVPPFVSYRDLGTSELGRCQTFAFGIGDVIFADGFEVP
ncbi:MAG: right-handed parallel beta-helix repeat-containing protein [Xanthomonadales bacterium]|nr:right-handed parallel beta-helix repeat-containing protein [Xanthomonadales bacterium]